MVRNQTLFDELVISIITGKLKPRERLVERDLMARFGVSRTPIREVIRRLESIGLLQCLPNKGAVITDFSSEDIENIYSVRVHVERLGAELSLQNLGPKEIKALQEINQQLEVFLKKKNLLQIIEKDKQFHQVIYEASRNRFLVQIIEELRLKSYIVAYYAWNNPDHIQVSISQHKGIIKALRDKNLDDFLTLVENQLISAKTFYLESLW